MDKDFASLAAGMIGISKQVKDFAIKLQAVRKEINDTETQIQDIGFAALHESDFFQLMEAWAKEREQKWLKSLKSSFMSIRNDTVKNANIESNFRSAIYQSDPFNLQSRESSAHIDRFIGLFGADHFMEIIKARYEEMNFLDKCLPLQDRPRAVANLEGKLSDLKAKENRMVSAAVDAGLSVD